MTALAGRRKRRTAIMIGIDVLALVLVVVMVLAGFVAWRHYRAAKSSVSEVPVQPLPQTATALFATVDDEGVLTSTTVFVLAPGDAAGGSIVSVPVSADATNGDGDQRLTLRQAYADGGADGLALAVESTLSITLDYWQVAEPGEAAALFLPLAPITVELPADVVTSTGDGTATVFERGQRALSAEEAVQVLTARDGSEPERLRRPNLEALWAGVAASVGGGRGTDVPAVDSFESLVGRLTAGTVGARGLPADPSAAETNPDALDVEQIDRAEGVLVFASIAPASMSAPLPGLVFRLEAPRGNEAQVKETIKAIMFLGGNVLSVNLDGPSQAVTSLYVYDQLDRSKAEQTNGLFGEVDFPDPDVVIDGIDVTVVLGTDYLGREVVATSSSSVPGTEP